MPRKRKAKKPSALTVQFRLNSRRWTISLKSYTAEDVRSIGGWVRRMAKAKAAGRDYDMDICTWLGKVSDEIHAKLAAVGLVEPRKHEAEKDGIRLGEFLDSYIAKRVDAKPTTRLVFGRARKHLVEFFGADRRLCDVTQGQAEDFALHLSAKNMAEATIRKMCGVARQFFSSAVKHRLIPANPFDAEGIKTAVRGNSDRFQFITTEDAEAVLAACPDAQWRLIFALSRWGGLRCPSEHLALKWEHVDWANNRMIIPQPKVVHHGTPERVIPLFPELRPHLEAAFDGAEPGTVWVITRYRSATQNLRTTFEKIIRRAGLAPWPRLFHNLRATRQTELSDRFPQHVVAKWLGNSEQVATRHYLNTTDAHFAQALIPLTNPTEKKSLSRGLTPATIQSIQAESSSDDEMKKPLENQGLESPDSSGDLPGWSRWDSKSHNTSRGFPLIPVLTTRIPTRRTTCLPRWQTLSMLPTPPPS